MRGTLLTVRKIRAVTWNVYVVIAGQVELLIMGGPCTSAQHWTRVTAPLCE